MAANCYTAGDGCLPIAKRLRHPRWQAHGRAHGPQIIRGRLARHDDQVRQRDGIKDRVALPRLSVHKQQIDAAARRRIPRFPNAFRGVGEHQPG